MKTIQPVNVWHNGQNVEATRLNAYAVNVQFNTSATFFYSLISQDGVSLSEGNLIMEGVDYQEWEQDTFAWDWIAGKLNLVITGDWVPPTPNPEA